MSAEILVGTASWSDPEFVRDWYPEGLPASQRLPYYAERFDMVELNSSFYGIPDKRQVQQWDKVTPGGFIFNVKLHKLLSRHSCEVKMLPPDLQKMAKTTPKGRIILNEEIEEAVAERFLESMKPLEKGGKLGVLLLQLSPGFSPRKHDLAELEPLLNQLGSRDVAVELRNRNWVEGDQLKETTAFLKAHGAAFVSVDAPQSDHFSVMPSLDVVTNPKITYLRLHGRNERGYVSGRSVAERFDYDYSDRELKQVAERVERLATNSQFTHVVFNNNRSDYAPTAALRFRRIIGQAVPAEISTHTPAAKQGTVL